MTHAQAGAASMPGAHVVAVGAQHLSYLKAGHGSAVVVIHGIGGHKEDWTGLIAALEARHTVYAIDMLGFGASSKDAAQITIADQAQAVASLLDAEHVQAASIVGNSVGGWVAATFAATYPHRVNKLVLVDAAGFKAMFEGPSPVNFYPADAAQMAHLLSFVRHDAAAHTQAYAEAALAAAQASGDAQAAERVFAGMGGSVRLEDVCDRVAAPTLVIWGAEDKLFPPAIADLVVAHVKGAEKAIIPDASHFPQLDNPGAFEATVAAFLQT